MKRYKKFHSIGKSQDEAIRSIPVNIRIEDVLADTEAEIQRISEEAGLAVMNMVMDNERERILRSGRGYRHGAQPGPVYFGVEGTFLEDSKILKDGWNWILLLRLADRDISGMADIDDGNIVK